MEKIKTALKILNKILMYFTAIYWKRREYHVHKGGKRDWTVDARENTQKNNTIPKSKIPYLGIDLI